MNIRALDEELFKDNPEEIFVVILKDLLSIPVMPSCLSNPLATLWGENDWTIYKSTSWQSYWKNCYKLTSQEYSNLVMALATRGSTQKIWVTQTSKLVLLSQFYQQHMRAESVVVLCAQLKQYFLRGPDNKSILVAGAQLSPSLTFLVPLTKLVPIRMSTWEKRSYITKSVDCIYCRNIRRFLHKKQWIR